MSITNSVRELKKTSEYGIEFLPGFLQPLIERFYFEQVIIALSGVGGGVETIAFKQAARFEAPFPDWDLAGWVRLGMDRKAHRICPRRLP
ncbi:MAG: hypothetical protein AAGU11_24075 [Syntrophobacteraceae bacterium]